MATVKLVSEEEATGKVRKIFEDIKKTKQIDFVPNVWRALATNPDYLESAWKKLKAVMTPGRLDMLTKEMIALAVSITNGCTYCINSHTAAVKKLGLDNEALGELIAVVDLYNGMNRVADAYQIEPDVRPKEE